MASSPGDLETRLEAATDMQEKIDLLNNLAWALLLSDPRRSRSLAEQAQRLATQGVSGNGPYLHGQAYSLMIQSILDWDLSNYQDALSRALAASAYFEKTGDQCKQAYTLKHIAGIHFLLGNHDQALEFGLAAIRMSEQCDDRNLLGSALNDVGYICLHVGKFPDALPQLFKSLDIHRETGSLHGQAQALDSIGKAYFLMEDYPQALSYELQSLELNREIGYARAEAEALDNIGKIHAASGDTAQALDCFERSLALSRDRGYKQVEATTLLDMGRTHLARQATDRALEILTQALAVAEAIQSKPVVFAIHAALAEGYEQAGDFRLALAHHKRFHAVKEEVFNEKTDSRLRSLQVSYEVDKAKHEAEIYQLKSVALQQEIAEREKLIAELDAFARTVAHDLKNPLSIIMGYGEMILEDLRTEGGAGSIGMVQSLLQAGDRTARIIDELLMLASVRREDIVPAPLDMAQIVRDAESQLARLIASSGAELIRPRRWPLALGHAPWVEEVWANYISNAIKYGGRPPHVELGAAREDGQVRFWVRDNGDGLSPDDQARLFREFTRLADIRVEGHGLGLSIVKRIVEKLGGTVGVESAGVPGQGCTFSFTLPAGQKSKR
ncbi:MAG TPA: tetratricopeptide repeat-containing sensor histidine kinase [Aggregatilineaceae bacterium]|nr:tetratricopeptide repeat-containing sensor histidine kinase [Aggregatilineaceae bacterium]